MIGLHSNPLFETDHDLNLELNKQMCNLMTFVAEKMEYITYFHPAMQQEDSDKFVDAVVRNIIICRCSCKEHNSHVDNQSRGYS